MGSWDLTFSRVKDGEFCSPGKDFSSSPCMFTCHQVKKSLFVFNPRHFFLCLASCRSPVVGTTRRTGLANHQANAIRLTAPHIADRPGDASDTTDTGGVPGILGLMHGFGCLVEERDDGKQGGMTGNMVRSRSRSRATQMLGPVADGRILLGRGGPVPFCR